MAVFATGAAFAAALILRVLGVRIAYAFLIGCALVPVFVLAAEFLLPHQGGGASMWPIALFFGGIYGAFASAAGVAAGDFLRKRSRADRE